MPSVAQSAPVLIIEDDPELRDALRELLSGEGYQVTTAADGQEGLARMGAPPRPGVVVLDLMLPRMDGFEFRVRQLEDPELAGIPVIILSGGADMEHKVARLGVAASLMKPLDFETLLDCVARCLPPN
ncbi:MAG TPA: response regulator transcription factor [Verrucomicrobiae bacterium]|nr:response regulator transcription factor [Verrucomicrobiae bacterium]